MAGKNERAGGDTAEPWIATPPLTGTLLPLQRLSCWLLTRTLLPLLPLLPLLTW